MAMTQELLAVVLFVVAIVGIACGVLLALFLLFRDEQQGMKKASQKFLALELEIAFVNRTDIYRQAIKRTFADLYGVSPGTVDVSWTTGKTVVVQCAGKTFLHPILSDPDDDAPEFTCLEEDPAIV
jgi:hypothetical protein